MLSYVDKQCLSLKKTKGSPSRDNRTSPWQILLGILKWLQLVDYLLWSINCPLVKLFEQFFYIMTIQSPT